MRQPKTKVTLMLYDLVAQQNSMCGIYHTGVEIGGVEYSFAYGAGIYECAPGSAPDARLKERIAMGECEMSRSDVQRAIDSLRNEFHGEAYDLITKNCNHFSDALCRTLLNKSIPGHINRMAWWGSWVSCLIPESARGRGPRAPGYAAAQGGGGGYARAPQQQSASFVAFGGSGQKLAGSTSNTSTNLTDGLLSRVGKSTTGGGGETQTPSTIAPDAREARAKAALARFEMTGKAGGN